MRAQSGQSSAHVFRKLQEVIPGGVNSPFRAFDQVGGSPPVLARGRGSRVYDLEGREYIDLCCGWGPLVLGHCHQAVVRAGQAALEDGALFGAPTPWELELAGRIREAFPSMERLRLVNSGAEAVMSALRVARATTGRSRILKFEGCYHGHAEFLDAAGLEAVQAGGALALGASRWVEHETLVARFNDLDSVSDLLEAHPAEVAAVIVEPVTGSMGVIPPARGFLEGLRDLCDAGGALLIFDEVLTGFRVSRGGAQELYGVRPDLTCLGKALGGGLPVGAYGGRAELMEQVCPLGRVYQAGTFCGNPVTTRSGIAALEEYGRPGFYRRLSDLAHRLTEGLRRLSPNLLVQNVGSLFSLGFGPVQLEDHRDAQRLDTRKFARFFQAMLAAGVYLPPSTYDAACVSAAHSAEDVDQVLEAAAGAIAAAEECSH